MQVQEVEFVSPDAGAGESLRSSPTQTAGDAMSYKARVTKCRLEALRGSLRQAQGRHGRPALQKPLPRGCYAANVLILNVALRNNIVRAKRTATIPVFMV